MKLWSFLSKGALYAVIFGVFAYGLLAAQLFLIGENPLDYHVDPLTVKSFDPDNQYLVAPLEFAAVGPSRQSPEFAVSPRELMIAFDAVALATPRTKLAAGAPSELWATYVQRTKYIRFPDYISVVAVGLPSGGSTVAVYSQSVYGANDLGVNKERVDGWLDQLGEALDQPK